MGIVAVGSLVLLFVLVRHTPRTAADLARLLGWAMAIAILVAPATRIGYLLYPVDFFVWAWLLRSEDLGSSVPVSADVGAGAFDDDVEDQSSSVTANMRTVNGVLSAGAARARAERRRGHRHPDLPFVAVTARVLAHDR